ncbi:MAG TPA: hypothetical protein VN980_18745 [Alphaproteobacteria bacterium]|nr:hypothetical protein [Alphaproteobacteria bacterium]
MALFLWPFALAIAGPAGLILLWSISFDAAFMFAFPFLGLWAFVALIALVVAVILAIERRWLGALSLALFPLAVLVTFLNFMSVWGFATQTGEYIHFRAKRAAYLADIAKLPTDKGPRLVVIHWGGFLGSYRAVVYDESDEVVLSEEKRSAVWKKRTERTELACEVVHAESVGIHFYIVRIAC